MFRNLSARTVRDAAVPENETAPPKLLEALAEKMECEIEALHLRLSAPLVVLDSKVLPSIVRLQFCPS